MRINSKFLRLPQVIDRTGYRKTVMVARNRFRHTNLQPQLPVRQMTPLQL